MTTQTTPKPLGELVVKDGQTVFWILEFNTQDWILARLIAGDRIQRLDTMHEYRLDDVKTCPAIPIIKPTRRRDTATTVF
jgi:hypothetical protein